jgi:hypothetical protein
MKNCSARRHRTRAKFVWRGANTAARQYLRSNTYVRHGLSEVSEAGAPDR